MKALEKVLIPAAIIALLLFMSLLQSCAKEGGQSPTETAAETGNNQLAKANDVFTAFRQKINLLKDELELTDEQAGKIKSIIKEHRQLVFENLPGNFADLTVEQKKEYFKSQRSELKDKIYNILTEKQIAQFEEIKERNLDKWNARKEELASNRSQLIKQLNLSGTQKEEIKNLFAERINERAAQGFGAENDGSFTTGKKERIKTFMNELSIILTDEQKAAVSEYKKEKYERFKQLHEN